MHGHFADHLDAIKPLVLVFKLAHDFPRARDQVGFWHLNGPVERGSSVEIAVLRVPGVLAKAEGFRRELIDDLGLSLDGHRHWSSRPRRLIQQNQDLVLLVQERQGLPRSVLDGGRLDRPEVLVPALVVIGIVVQIEAQGAQVVHQRINLDRRLPFHLLRGGKVHQEIRVAHPDDARPVVVREDHVVPRLVIFGSLMPLDPRDEIASPLRAQGCAGDDGVFVKALGIVRIGQPVVLGRMEVGDEEVLPLQPGNSIFQELHLKLEFPRAVEPAVAVLEDLFCAIAFGTGLARLAQGAHRLVRPVAEAEHRLGERLLQRF